MGWNDPGGRREASAAWGPAAPISRLVPAARLASLAPLIVGIGGFTVLINLLALTGAIYMLQVYDRVLPSHSLPTLVVLSALVAFLFAVQGLLDATRARLLVRLGTSVEERLAPPLFTSELAHGVRVGEPGALPSSLRDLAEVRAFLSSLAPTVLFDAPFVPLYVGLCFLLHPLLGATALGGAMLTVVLARIGEVRSRARVKALGADAHMRARFLESAARMAEAARALGMTSALAARLAAIDERCRHGHEGLGVSTANLAALSRTFRLLLQSAMLGVGAWLVIEGAVTGGVMIAGSVLMARALAPVELAAVHWKGFLSVREAWRRLAARRRAAEAAHSVALSLPEPCESLAVNHVSVVAPGGRRVILRDVCLALSAGDAVALMGPSGSGKTSLIRALAGIWPAAGGEVSLDGARLDQWEPDRLGRFIGYLPQEVQLLDGTVADNIARFDPHQTAEAVIAAAKAADAHELILRLPAGYDTAIGEGGHLLSAGQRQRVALARALYGAPFLIILDEPNAHLDAEGEAALLRAIEGARARRAIVAVAAHRPGVLRAVSHVAILREGRLEAFGPCAVAAPPLRGDHDDGHPANLVPMAGLQA
ncbi:type I secretion system permease/ATPase [Xanthobacter sp. KR7-225]|uniref:type I secretion system permease/ATPase n=1 Tax=Xanthobacter sp. KR7-225 TaxID=3156613 RepID=UPI0032B50021